jgi:hypothetical protein
VSTSSGLISGAGLYGSSTIAEYKSDSCFTTVGAGAVLCPKKERRDSDSHELVYTSQLLAVVSRLL